MGHSAGGEARPRISGGRANRTDLSFSDAIMVPKASFYGKADLRNGFILIAISPGCHGEGGSYLRTRGQRPRAGKAQESGPVGEKMLGAVGNRPIPAGTLAEGPSQYRPRAGM
jgi:hypothetical protein